MRLVDEYFAKTGAVRGALKAPGMRPLTRHGASGALRRLPRRRGGRGQGAPLPRREHTLFTDH